MGGRGSSSGVGGIKLEKIKVDPRWAYQPDEQTDLNDLVKNPVPYVGVGKDFEIGMAVEEAIQPKYESNVEISISKLKTFQPFVLESGVKEIRRWDSTERPYVVEYKGSFYLMDGNHRVANAMLKKKKKIRVDISHRVDR